MKAWKLGILVGSLMLQWGQGMLGAVEMPDLARLQQLQESARLVVPKVLPATVAIANGAGSGSGVVVQPDGLILTAAHVVEGAKRVDVIFPNGREVQAKVLGIHFTRDIAMVQLLGEGPWPSVTMGNSDSLQLGDWVLALGHAQGFDPNRQPPLRFARIIQNSKRGFLTTDCTLIGGDSGGPLFDMKGNLIGIHSSIGNNLSINNHAPVGAFMESWQDLMAGKIWGELGRHPLSDPNSPAIGFVLGPVRGRGAGVAEVPVGSPAAVAGLEPGDIIVQINGIEVEGPNELLREVSRHQAGEKVTLTVKRRGLVVECRVVLKRRSEIYQEQE